MKDFDTLENLLYSHSTNEIIPGLERISRLLERLGNPQNSFRSIHIVGTNGKGSTGAFISSILKESGYRTGFYSSPHLESPGERLLIDGAALPPEDWINAANEAVKCIRPDEDLPSYFELLTAAAFVLAKNSGIQAGVVEAGLGGKLDATNTMSNTVCSVIASVSIDHTEYLGSTLESIAGEKFAVVKKNIPACFSGLDPSLIPMFYDVCSEKGSIPFVVPEMTRIENVNVSPDGNTFDFYTKNLELKGIKTGLIGSYQVKNAALALSAVSCILGAFPEISEASIREGMLKAEWPGRLEIISREPLIILDGGHNFDGVKNLCSSIKELWPDRKFAVVYAAMKDKDYSGCLELMSENLKPNLYVTCVPEMKRSAAPDELLKCSEKYSWGNEPLGFSDPSEAVRKAIDDGNNSVLICGSLYLIGWIKRCM